MNERQLEQHVPIVGILHLVGGAISVSIGAFLFVFLTSIGAVVDDPVAFRVLSVVGFTVGTFLVVLSAPGIAAGYGLLKRRSWARSLAVAVGAINLLNIPIGTVIGVYTLSVLLQDDEDGYFAALKGA